VGKRSTEEQAHPTPPLPPPMSRRDFLAGAAASAVIGPRLLRAAIRLQDRQAILHVATGSRDGYVHTYALMSGECTLLGATAIDSLAALAPHPLLPVLYVARDCTQWENLPRGVIEIYAVERNTHPLTLIARTPMALSATSPRSLAVSSCGGHLLVSASTGGAWNAFALDRNGVPVGVAVARKEMGVALDSRTVSLPTPHGVAFSPHAPFAIGTDPGSGRLSLLLPSPEGIELLARCQTPHELMLSSPVWTSDGRYIVVANARNASLSMYETKLASANRSNASVYLLSTTPTATPVSALLAHPEESAVFIARPQHGGSSLELWKVDGSELRVVSDTWIAGHVGALAEHIGYLWAASHDRLIRIPIRDLRSPHVFDVALPMRGVQAIATQSLTAL
jgi:Lactonase, 7-bladed beta-propeller